MDVVQKARQLISIAPSRARRVLRWYLAPSGLLLASSLVLLLLAAWGIGPARVLVTAGIVVMGVFLPYRFSRQQGVAADRATAAATVAHQLSAQNSRALTKVRKELAKKNAATAATARAAATVAESAAAATAAATTGSEAALLSLNSLFAEQAGRLHRIQQQLDELAQLPANVDALTVRANQVDAAVEQLRSNVSAAEEQHRALEERATALGRELQQSISVNAAELVDLIPTAAELVELIPSPVELAPPLEPPPAPALAPAVSMETIDELVGSVSAVEAGLASLRSDLSAQAASLGPKPSQFSRVALIVSPERSGTTWTFDVLRSLPGAGQSSSPVIYDLMGVRGNRYPSDLVDLDPTGEAIEIRQGHAARVPSFREQRIDVTDRDLIAVEKLHPSAVDFDHTMLLAGLNEITKAVGRTQLVLLIRDPVDAYLSFVSYQERSGWHRDIEREEVAALFVASYRMMAKLAEHCEDVSIVAYEDLARNPTTAFTELAFQAAIKTEEDRVAAVIAATQRWRKSAAMSDYFGKIAKDNPGFAPSQTLVGRGISDAEKAALEEARDIYATLWERRTVE